MGFVVFPWLTLVSHMMYDFHAWLRVLGHESHQVTRYAHLIGLRDSGRTHRSQVRGFHSMTRYESWLGVTHTYESRQAMTPNESCCEIPSPDSYESCRYLLNQSGVQSMSPGGTHDSELWAMHESHTSYDSQVWVMETSQVVHIWNPPTLWLITVSHVKPYPH